MRSRRGGYVGATCSHHPARLCGHPPVPPRCIASGVRRLKRAQARFSKPRLTLGQEGNHFVGCFKRRLF